MAKQIVKNPKYEIGDILIYTNPISKSKTTVILESRYDNNRTSDVSWWVYDYPNKDSRFAVPERELLPID